MKPKERVAVIGSGISGLLSAYILRNDFEVTLFEADERLGGHAHTHTVLDSSGLELNIDSGFIVHNNRTYPYLIRLFEELGIATIPTEMSMSINCLGCGLEYAGGKSLLALFAQPGRVFDWRFLRMLLAVPRFYKLANQLIDADEQTNPTWGEFLITHRFNDYFIKHFAIPLVACVWSAGDKQSMDYPAKHLFEFLKNHGMLELGNSPKWRTVKNGSREYVNAIRSKLSDVRLATAVLGVVRNEQKVEVKTQHGIENFDRAVIATHADIAASILLDAEPEEFAALCAIKYSKNKTRLHTDSSVLPANRAAVASWNYQLLGCASNENKVKVSYYMNKLMSLDTRDTFLVTLNGEEPDSDIIAEMNYEHPIFTKEAVAAAKFLKTAGGERLAFAGAHLGWGFHEDGARSAVWAAEKFGVKW